MRRSEINVATGPETAQQRTLQTANQSNFVFAYNVNYGVSKRQPPDARTKKKKAGEEKAGEEAKEQRPREEKDTKHTQQPKEERRRNGEHKPQQKGNNQQQQTDGEPQAKPVNETRKFSQASYSN